MSHGPPGAPVAPGRPTHWPGCTALPGGLRGPYKGKRQQWRTLMDGVTVEVRPNGPYIVSGVIELRDTDGNVVATQARTVLCRCGASTKKPFCDGTHSKVGFQAAAQAVPDSAEKT